MSGQRTTLAVAGLSLVIGGLAAVLWIGSEDVSGHEPAVAGEAVLVAPRGGEPRRAVDPAKPTFGAGRTVSEPAAPPTSAGFRVSGTIVDGWRRRQAASIEVMMDGRPAVTGKSGADGRFAVDTGLHAVPEPRRGTILARDHVGASGLLEFEIAPDSRDPHEVGVILLRDGGRLAVRVTRGSAPVAGARVFLGRWNQLEFGPFTTDAQGTFEAVHLQRGSYRIVAFEGRDGRGEATVEIPRAIEVPVDVELAPAWHLVVRVIDELTGAPVPDVKLAATSSYPTGAQAMTSFATITASPIEPTDSDGRSRLEGLSPELPVRVRIVASDEEDVFGRGRSTPGGSAAPGAEELVIAIPKGETFRFPIVADETDGPPDGAVVRLSLPDGYGGDVPPATGRITGGELVIDRVRERCLNILATADDGSMALVRILGDARETKVGSAAHFKRPRQLTVTVRDTAGEPLTDQDVALTGPGNTPLGRTVALDAGGVAGFSGIYPGQVHVRLSGAGRPAMFAGSVGSVDLTRPGPGHLDVVVGRERACVMQVTVDGEARLPGSYALWGGSTEVGPIEEDAERGTLRFTVRPQPGATELELVATAEGCPQVTVAVPILAEDQVLACRVDFTTGATVLVRVVPPVDQQHDVSLQLCRETWGWRSVRRPGSKLQLGMHPTELLYDALIPGRYRARDALTGLVSDALDVAPGSRNTLVLDLSHVGSLRLRVTGPADEGYPPATVTVEAAGLDRTERGGGRAEEITVPLGAERAVRIPGDRLVTLRVVHPQLVSGADRGVVEVRSPGGTVTFELVPGAECRFRLADGVKADDLDGLRVGLHRREEDDRSIQEVFVTEGGGRFGGYVAGRYTLWFDAPRLAPLVLPDVDLGPALTDLGELTFPRGATLRCRVLRRDDQVPSSISLTATATTVPTSVRRGVGRRDEILVRGLGSGRFRIEAVGLPDGVVVTPAEVESTGAGEIAVTIDLR